VPAFVLLLGLAIDPAEHDDGDIKLTREFLDSIGNHRCFGAIVTSGPVHHEELEVVNNEQLDAGEMEAAGGDEQLNNVQRGRIDNMKFGIADVG
jgi:hypothetical protein